MPNVRPIRSRAEYDAAVRRLDVLMATDPEPGSVDDDELELLQMVIGRYDDEHAKEWPLSPIEAIEFRMQQNGLEKKDLAPFLGSLSRVSEVLSGRRELTVGMIRKLHEGLGIPAKSLIGSSRLEEGSEYADEDYERFPLKEMQDRGFFAVRDLSLAGLRSKAKELMSPWIQQASMASPALLRAPLHQSGNRTMDDYALLAWKLIVMDKARKIEPRGVYKPGFVTDAWLRSIAKLSVFDDGPRLAQEQLSRHGIRLVIVRHFSKTYLDGAAMLDAKGPIIALTLRHDRVDNFWFALLHELKHVISHLAGSRLFIADNLDDKARHEQAEEGEADRAAQEALIPSELWERAPVRVSHALEDALALASEAEVHPAIVAGRVRFETGNWRLLSGLISSAGPVSGHFAEQTV